MFEAKSFRAVPATLLLCAMLAGCGVHHSQVGGGFSESGLARAGATGLPIQVDGSVGGVRGDALAKAVAAAMPKTIDTAAMSYAPCEAYTECPRDHLVWTFGPPAARPASAYPPALATNISWLGNWRPAPDEIAVKLAVFQGGNVVASVEGQTRAAAPDDPAFQALVAQMSDSILGGPGLLDSITP